MPKYTADSLNEQLEGGSDFMVSARESNVGGLSLIHAMRTMSDGMSRLADQQDRQSSKLGEVSEVIHGMDKRLAIIEANSLVRTVDEHDKRIEALEALQNQRIGAVNASEWVLRHWPAIIGFFGLIAALVVTGRINL